MKTWRILQIHAIFNFVVYLLYLSSMLPGQTITSHWCHKSLMASQKGNSTVCSTYCSSKLQWKHQLPTLMVLQFWDGKPLLTSEFPSITSQTCPSENSHWNCCTNDFPMPTDNWSHPTKRRVFGPTWQVSCGAFISYLSGSRWRLQTNII